MDGFKTCEGCGYVITSKYLSLNGEDWHSTCVLCDECSGPVFTGETTTKYHAQDGKIYCKDCVTQLFQVCADCGEPAKKYVKALGKIWHTFHFKCASCHEPLDSYAEVSGEAFCIPCHNRMSAKNFTKLKRRSFGTEKREQAARDAVRPPWAQKKTNSNAPKSALDVLHKSWFKPGPGVNVGRPPTPTSPTASPSPSPTPGANGSASPRSGTSSPTTFSRPYTPSSPPTIPKSSPSVPLSKPAGNRVAAAAPTPQRPGYMKPAAPQHEEPKRTWGQPAPAKQPAAAPQNPAAGYRSALKPVPNNASPAGRTAAAPATNGYTNITYAHPATPAPAKVKHQMHVDLNIPAGAVNVSEVLEAIFRPLSEDEIGSLAFQAITLLAEIHNREQLHNNIKHKTIFISPAGVVSLIENDGEDESKVGGASIKFKAPESTVSVASDVYSLGVALWTSADYLLDEEEEPALSATFCDFIGEMTEDEPENRPPIKKLATYVEKYRDTSGSYLAALIKEVERKRLLMKGINEDKERKQKSLGKDLLNEIVQGVALKKVDLNSLTPAAKQTNPHEAMCSYIKSFNFNKLRRIDPSKLPQKQYKLNPRERLMQAVKSGSPLRRALVVAGFDINALIVPVPNHPTYGTIFRDISSLFTVPKVSAAIALQVCTRFTGNPPDLFVATPTDAGVFFASLVAEYFNRGVIVLQNAGRLPRKMEKYTCGYEILGYVSHSLELQLQRNLVKEGTRVVLIDEMLVNGGILEAARIILEQTGAVINEVVCIAELEGFGGRQKIKNFDCNVHALYTFNDNQPEHR